jgi:hypothetical protein
MAGKVKRFYLGEGVAAGGGIVNAALSIVA